MFGTSESFAQNLRRWYTRHRRDLPWRRPKGCLDPYHVLVSETMLQQTQVATVVPYFLRFIERFPTISSLAAASERDVLRLWQGLGYYSRARNLRASARQICTSHNGRVPSDVQDLLDLPGVGRYTAGAIASIAFDRREPILDGNVCRLLCRLDGIRSDPRSGAVREKLWQRAEEILPRKRIGEFNSALMELGATVCTPRSPSCAICPVRKFCRAHAAGIQDRIPPPKASKVSPLVRRRVFCIRHRNRWLIEQRPGRGRWAGMWQFVTVPHAQSPEFAMLLTEPRRIGRIQHALSHRQYRFDIFACELRARIRLPSEPPRVWIRLSESDSYPLPRPHLTIVDMLRSSAIASC